MTTTELIELLQRYESGGATGRSTDITLELVGETSYPLDEDDITLTYKID